MYRIVWEFEADPARVPEFEREYGVDGAWVAFFREAGGFLGTDLYRNLAHPERYLTVDRWTSRDAYEAFRQTRREEYAAIDARCAALTRAERLVAEVEQAG